MRNLKNTNNGKLISQFMADQMAGKRKDVITNKI